MSGDFQLEPLEEENHDLLKNPFKDAEENRPTKIQKQNKFLKFSIIILLFVVLVLCLAWIISAGEKMILFFFLNYQLPENQKILTRTQ